MNCLLSRLVIIADVFLDLTQLLSNFCVSILDASIQLQLLASVISEESHQNCAILKSQPK